MFRVYRFAEGSFHSAFAGEPYVVQVLLPCGAPRRVDALNKGEGGGVERPPDLTLTLKTLENTLTDYCSPNSPAPNRYMPPSSDYRLAPFRCTQMRAEPFWCFSKSLQACPSMENLHTAVDHLVQSSNTVFILLGAVMVLAMHAGFAFLEVGTVRHKNQVNALSKILSDFAMSTLAYFFIGYWISYGVTFLQPAAVISADHGYGLVKFFFLLTFAAAIPAIISGGIAERARFAPQMCATVLIVAFVYPFFEGVVWNGNFGVQAWLLKSFGASFHDFAGSVVVHAMGGWLALAAVLLLGPRNGRYREGRLVAYPT
jgi:hypothetical protein